jgi:hypothetical protein
LRLAWLAVVVSCVPSPVTAQAAAEIARGYFDGNSVGSRTGVVAPYVMAAVPGPILAVTTREKLSNNQIVATLVTQTAIAAAASYVAGLAFKPRPSREQELELSGQPPLYVSSWRRGYREASGQRRIVARVAGVVTGAVISAVIYGVRAE